MHRVAWLMGRPLAEDTQTELDVDAPPPNTLQVLQDCISLMWHDFMEYTLIAHRLWVKLKLDPDQARAVGAASVTTQTLGSMLQLPLPRTQRRHLAKALTLRTYYACTPDNQPNDLDATSMRTNPPLQHTPTESVTPLSSETRPASQASIRQWITPRPLGSELARQESPEVPPPKDKSVVVVSFGTII